MPIVSDSPSRSGACLAGRLRPLCGLLCLWLVASGCGMTTRHYTVKTLPQRWRARPTANARTIGLTKLASDPMPVDQIGRGDVLDVTMAAGFAADDAANFKVRVNDSGNADLPEVGSVSMAGLTLEEAESAIAAACIQRRIFRTPHVTVTMKQRKMVQVVVVGAVEKEGTYLLPVGSSGLLQAISQAGGLTKEAGTNVDIRYPNRPELLPDSGGRAVAQASGESGERHSLAGRSVPVQTSGPQNVRIDLATLTSEDPRKLDLPDGAVVMVERCDPPALQVIGLVKEPQQIEFPVGKDVHLLDAIAMAKGQNSLVADKIYIIRRRPEEPEPALIQVSMRAAKRNGAENLLLEPGDTISVEQTPSTVLLEVVKAVGFNINAYARAP